jgi:uncharacterized protein
MTSFSLRQVKLRPGQQHREAIEVELEHTGTVFSLAFDARLHGPCYRCLGDAVLDLPIHGREYQAESPEDEQLTNQYLSADNLEVSRWARDLAALALPEKILCRPDCAGLCPVCGANLNDEPHEHAERERDPRWAALESLRDQGTR